jgi:hypothetical protein
MSVVHIVQLWDRAEVGTYNTNQDELGKICCAAKNPVEWQIINCIHVGYLSLCM